VKFRITAGTFTLTATPTAPASGTRRAPINAIQIVPVATAAPLRAISVSFLGSTTTAMGPEEIAGAAPAPNRNNAAGALSAAPLILVDETGTATATTMTWTSHNVWMTPITDQAGNARMMKGYIDTSSTSTTTIAVADLVPSTYDVYVYVDGDNRTYARTASYTITASPTTTVSLTDPASTNFAGTFIQASGSNGNYVRFRITGTGFTLAAKSLSGVNTTLRAPVNGLQIVPVPAP
jgi:hypothetical protein